MVRGQRVDNRAVDVKSRVCMPNQPFQHCRAQSSLYGAVSVHKSAHALRAHCRLLEQSGDFVRDVIINDRVDKFLLARFLVELRWGAHQ